MAGGTPAAFAQTAPPSNFYVQVDDSGPNDVPGQVDMTQMGRDNTHDATYFKLFWNWDTVDFTGQTGDACALFDFNGNHMIDAVVCGQVQNGPNWTAANQEIVQTALVPSSFPKGWTTGGSPFVFRCTDTANDRCQQPSDPQPYVRGTDVVAGVLGTLAASPPANLVTATDPFPAGEAYPKDTSFEVDVTRAYLTNLARRLGPKYDAIPNPNPQLENVCSYPSAGNGGNNNPFDCVVTPGAGYLVINKATSPASAGTWQYTVTATGASTSSASPSVTTAAGTGTGTSGQIALNPANTYTVLETQNQYWDLTNVVCTKADGSSTGTKDLTNNRITGVAFEAAKATTCTFTNTKQKPQLSLTKTAKPAGPVSAGESIGFDITVSNSGAAGTGPASNVKLTDLLPAGTDISWSISPAYAGPGTCAITSGTLSCSFGDLAPGASATVSVVSGTKYGSCGTYNNTAKVTVGYGDAPADAQASVTVQCPSVTVKKTADKAVVNAGDTIGFVIEVSNGGPGVAKGITINDPLPTGTGLSWSVEAANTTATGCAISAAGILTCGPQDLAANTSVQVHVTSPTEFASCSTTAYANIVTVKGSNIGADKTAQASVTVQCPKVSVIKTADADSVSAGDNIGFTITVANSADPGTGTAKNVVLEDSLPTGTGIGWSINPAVDGCSIAGSTLSCTARDLAPGASFSVHVTSGTDYASCGAYPNSATATPGNAPPVTSSQASITVDCPDLWVTKTADKATVNAGDGIGYVIKVGNKGPGIARNVALDDLLPAGPGLNWSIASQPAGDPCQILAGTLTCQFGDLAAGAEVSVHVTSPTVGNVTPSSCGTYNNTAKATATNAPDVISDPPVSITVNCGQINISKTAVAATVSAGDPIGFDVKVWNSGAGQAYNVVVTDQLPANNGLSWTITPPVPGCAIDGSGKLTCNLGIMDPGASVTIHLTSPTTSASCAAIPNTANVNTDNDGSAQANASITVNCPDLTVSKTADDGAIHAGDAAAFTIIVQNAGSGIARNVTLADTLPAGINWTIEPAVPGCSISGVQLSCNFGDLAAGATRTIHVAGATSTALCGDLTNFATVAADNEANTGNNQSLTATITVQCGGLKVTKSVDWSGTNPVTTQTFRICITGPSYSTPNCQDADFDGGPLTWGPLIPGQYAVTEIDPGKDWIVTITGSPATVPEDGTQAAASVSNVLRTFKLIVLVCEERPSKLYASMVYIGAAQFQTMASDSVSDPTLCALPGVPGLRSGTYNPKVVIDPAVPGRP